MKVMIVEDDPASRKYMQESLEVEGLTVHSVDDGEAGFKGIREFAPDLVLLDIHLPKMNGLDVLEEIRKEDSDTIIVIMTAYGSEEYSVRALRLGANNYLSKPVRNHDLTALVRKYGYLIAHRVEQDGSLSKVTERSATLHFPCVIGSGSKIAQMLVDEARGGLPESKRSPVHLSLTEILNNAIEFGSLGITPEEKLEAQKNGYDAYLKLQEEKMTERNAYSKEIRVDFKMNESACEWCIQDDGDGFDWESLPKKDALLDPLDLK